MKVQTTKPFTLRDASTGALFSPAKGAVVDVTSDLGAALIADGLAVAYTLVEPTGTKNITANGTNIDVSAYAKADVAVPGPTGNISITENGENSKIQYNHFQFCIQKPPFSKVCFCSCFIQNRNSRSGKLYF